VSLAIGKEVFIDIFQWPGDFCVLMLGFNIFDACETVDEKSKAIEEIEVKNDNRAP